MTQVLNPQRESYIWVHLAIIENQFPMKQCFGCMLCVFIHIWDHTVKYKLKSWEITWRAYQSRNHNLFSVIWNLLEIVVMHFRDMAGCGYAMFHIKISTSWSYLSALMIMLSSKCIHQNDILTSILGPAVRRPTETPPL